MKAEKSHVRRIKKTALVGTEGEDAKAGLSPEGVVVRAS